MGLRPGHCYSDSSKNRAYTRIAVTVPKKNFIGAAPGLKIRQFNMGFGGKEYTHIVDLCSNQTVQLRDNALESARISINRYLVKNIGKESFFMKLRVFPHHFMRENKQAQGAGADRVSQGMSHSFGKIIGRAARVKKGQVLMSVLCDEKDIDFAKKGLMRANAKFTCPVYVKIHQDIDSIGTRPTTTRDMRLEEQKAKEAAKLAAEAEKTGKKPEAKNEEKTEDKKEETK